MKTRDGFVSNSSSSSFVLMVEKSAHDEALKKMTPYGQAVVEQLIESTKSFKGVDLVVLTECYNQSYSTWDYLEVDEELKTDDEGSKYDAWEQYQSLLSKEDSLSVDIDM